MILIRPPIGVRTADVQEVCRQLEDATGADVVAIDLPPGWDIHLLPEGRGTGE